MKKHNLIKISLSAVVLMAAILFTGCTKDTRNAGSVPNLSFNISNAKALAAGSADIPPSRNAQSSREAAPSSFLQKILENGSAESAFNITGGEGKSYWANLDAVIKPPAYVNSSDILLHFDALSRVKVRYEEWPTGNWYLGSLLLVHPDDSYVDIGMEDAEEYKPDLIRYPSCAKYTPDGKILYISETWGHTVKSKFKSYDPSTNKTEVFYVFELEDNNTQFQEFQISNDGKYAYLSITCEQSEGSMHYLRVLSIEDPSDFVDLGKVVNGIHGWSYSSYDDCLYYSMIDKSKEEAGDSSASVTYKIDKTGKGQKEQIYDNICNDIIPTAKNKIWNLSNFGIENTEVLFNILSSASGTLEEIEEKIEFEILPSYMYSKDYRVVGTNIYLHYFKYKDDSMFHYDTIYGINTSTKESANIMQNIPDFEKISISSWSVNEEDLFISGFYEDGNAANFKVDLKSLAATQIDSSTAFTCMAAL